MNVHYSDKARQSEAYTLLQQATKRLEELVGQSTEPVKAEWDRAEDARGQPLYTLRLSRLSDGLREASASFTPEELQPSTHLRFRLYELWDSVLRERLHKMLQNMRNSGD